MDAQAALLRIYTEEARRDGSRALYESLVLKARTAGLAAQMELAGRTLKGQHKQAERLGARHVATVTPSGIRLRARKRSAIGAILASNDATGTWK